MKAELEVYAAHDRLIALLNRELPTELAPKDTQSEAALVGALNVLCWVLEHDHNPRFQELLDAMDEHMAQLGLALERPNN